MNASNESIGGWDKALLVLTGYFVISILTLPFIGIVWLGEIPLLAIIQLPKIFLADWLRVEVVMEIIEVSGFSRGSFSPDYRLARPYALAIAYLIPMAGIACIGGYRHRSGRQLSWRLLCLVFAAAALDYIFTLIFADVRAITIY